MGPQTAIPSKPSGNRRNFSSLRQVFHAAEHQGNEGVAMRAQIRLAKIQRSEIASDRTSKEPEQESLP
jgi:hypothetical protein